MGFFDFIGDVFSWVGENITDAVDWPDISIFLKEKIDENILANTLIRIGLIEKRIEKRYFQDNNIIIRNDNYFYFSSCEDLAKIRIDAKNSCIKIYVELSETVEPTNNKDKSSSDLDNENKFIFKIKKILFKEKILNEEYDKSEEYKNNIEKYEANIDNIIERIEEEKKRFFEMLLLPEKKPEKKETVNETEEEKEEKNPEPYNLFIIKHFIKFVMDKYKEEATANEDNSAKEDTKDTINNPFIADIEQKEE